MTISKAAQDYHERMFPGCQSKLLDTDPEFIERFDNFAFDEVVSQVRLDDRTAMMSHLAFLIDIISVNVPFIGYPRSLNALRCVNEAAGK